MTEEIIIDGVDVAGCCYYESKNDTGKWCDLTCTRGNAPVFRCEKMPNCYYKQLKRLEQENEKLKKEVKQIGSDFIKKGDYARELEQENKELKEELSSYKHPDVVTLLTNWRTGELDRIHNKIANERDTYHSALEEIRNYCNRIEQGSVIGTQDCLINSIKNITNEVLNEK